jgi:hypothetical protein
MTDRTELEELVSRYGAMADERTFDAADRVLCDDVVAEYPFGRHVGRDAVVEAGRSALGAFAATQHVITNTLIAVDGGQATIRANLVAVHVQHAHAPDVHFDVGGWYRFSARRTDAGWRLSHVLLTAVWTAGARADAFAEPSR